MPPSASTATDAGPDNRPGPAAPRVAGPVASGSGRAPGPAAGAPADTGSPDPGASGLGALLLGGRMHPLAAAAVVLVLVLGIVARFVAPSVLWLDEAQSVAIARLPLPQLFDALRQDGSPPLYYLLLHGWIALFGTGSFAVRALSGVIGVLTLPLAYRVTRQLAGRRTAFVVLLLLATSPFAIRYSSETRMYSLLLLLTVLGAMALRAVFRSDGPWPVVAVAAVTAALELTHLWGFDLLAAVALLALAGLRTRRRESVRVLVGLAAGSLVFLLWLPSLLVQLAHTGTPWASTKGLASLPVALSAWAGGSNVQAWVLSIALVLLAALGVLAVPTRRGAGAQLHLALRARPSRIVLLTVSVGTLVIAAIVSGLSHSGVSGRYTVVALPAFLVLVALGVTALPTVRARGIALVLLTGLGLGAALPGVVTPRSQADQVASALSAASPGDVVVFCPDQLGPAVARLAPPWLDLVVYPDLRPADRVDWTDYAQRNTAVPSAEVASAVLNRAEGRSVWVVTGSGYRVPSDDRCRAFVQAIAAVRGPQTLVVGRRGGVYEGERLQVFPAAAPAPAAAG